jgi:hypothetical protein
LQVIYKVGSIPTRATKIKVMKKKLESMLSKMHPVEIYLTAVSAALVISLVLLVVVTKVFF